MLLGTLCKNLQGFPLSCVPYGGFLSHGGTPSSIQLWGVPPWLRKPPYIYIYICICIYIYINKYYTHYPMMFPFLSHHSPIGIPSFSTLVDSSSSGPRGNRSCIAAMGSSGSAQPRQSPGRSGEAFLLPQSWDHWDITRYESSGPCTYLLVYLSIYLSIYIYIYVHIPISSLLHALLLMLLS